MPILLKTKMMIIYCTKRKIIYLKDSEQVRDNSVDIKKSKKYPK